MEEFKGKLGNYKIVLTEDNTKTIWSEYFDENCHNTSGAKEETIYNYIEGCEINNFFATHPQMSLNVLDVGFGPGLGLLYLQSLFPTNLINYFSVEIDPVLIEWAFIHTFKNEISIMDRTDLYIKFKYKNITAIIFIGDARETIPKAISQNLIPPLQAVFQDPFSPKKNPTLWTVEWFYLLKSVSATEVIMCTYSSSISIRKSMLEAGFIIENRKGFGKKRTMTKARLIGSVNPELIEELKRSPIESLKDSQFNL